MPKADAITDPRKGMVIRENHPDGGTERTITEVHDTFVWTTNGTRRTRVKRTRLEAGQYKLVRNPDSTPSSTAGATPSPTRSTT